MKTPVRSFVAIKKGAGPPKKEIFLVEKKFQYVEEEPVGGLFFVKSMIFARKLDKNMPQCKCVRKIGIYYIDENGLPVCHLKLLKRNKVFKEIAAYVRKSVGWVTRDISVRNCLMNCSKKA